MARRTAAALLAIGLAIGLSLTSSSCGGGGDGGGSPTGPGPSPAPAEIRVSFRLSRTVLQNAVLPGQEEDVLKSEVSVHVDAPDSLLQHATLYLTGYLPDQVPSPSRWQRNRQTGIDPSGNGSLELESFLLPSTLRPEDRAVTSRWDASVALADTSIEVIGAFDLTFLRPTIHVDLSYFYEGQRDGVVKIHFAVAGPFDFSPGEEIPEPRDLYLRCGKVVREYWTPNSRLVGGNVLAGCLGGPVYASEESPSGTRLHTLTAVRVPLDPLRRFLEVEDCPENLPCSTFEIDRLACPLPGSADGVEDQEVILDLPGDLAFDWVYSGEFMGRAASASLTIQAQVDY